MSSVGGFFAAFLLATNLFGNFAAVPMVGLYSYSTILQTEAYEIQFVYVVKGDNISFEDMEKIRATLETRLDAQNIFNRTIIMGAETKEIHVSFNSNTINSENINQFAKDLSAKANLTFRDTDGTILLSGKDISHADVEPRDVNGMTQYGVKIAFTTSGGELFYGFTQKMIGKNLSIYMDDILISSPIVQEAISEGSAVITGLETKEQAGSLAATINGGVMDYDLELKSTLLWNEKIDPSIQ